jgi:SAM-dependent methyltransferase
MAKKAGPILSGILGRYEKIRAGLDVGFADAALSQTFRQLRGGVWMTVECSSHAVAAAAHVLPAETVLRLGEGEQLPFEDDQFDVVALNGAIISQVLVREIHRVLLPAGCLFFTVPEERKGGRDSTLARLYNLFLKNGFDIVGMTRPPWWHFGADGRTLTICARKKAWKEHLSIKVWG